MGKVTEAQKKAIMKYDTANTKKMTFKFNLKTDKDILNALDSVSSKQGYIKALIREDLARKGLQVNE